ncbi:hypothetical protein FHG87_013309 [Trinorchestia longiramus]|nr:hypothetical protein FHG87_013309 [Trinorchestia longiramus]
MTSLRRCTKLNPKTSTNPTDSNLPPKPNTTSRIDSEDVSAGFAPIEYRKIPTIITSHVSSSSSWIGATETTSTGVDVTDAKALRTDVTIAQTDVTSNNVNFCFDLTYSTSSALSEDSTSVVWVGENITRNGRTASHATIRVAHTTTASGPRRSVTEDLDSGYFASLQPPNCVTSAAPSGGSACGSSFSASSHFSATFTYSEDRGGSVSEGSCLSAPPITKSNVLFSEAHLKACRSDVTASTKSGDHQNTSSSASTPIIQCGHSETGDETKKEFVDTDTHHVTVQQGFVSNDPSRVATPQEFVSKDPSRVATPQEFVSKDPSRVATPQEFVSKDLSRVATPQGFVSNYPSRTTTPQEFVSKDPSRVATPQEFVSKDPSRVATPQGFVSNYPSQTTTPQEFVSNDLSRVTTPLGFVSNDSSRVTTSQGFISNYPSRVATPQEFISNDLSRVTTPQGFVSNNPSQVTTPQGFVSNDPSQVATPQGFVSNDSPRVIVTSGPKNQRISSSIKKVSIDQYNFGVLPTKKIEHKRSCQYYRSPSRQDVAQGEKNKLTENRLSVEHISRSSSSQFCNSSDSELYVSSAGKSPAEVGVENRSTSAISKEVFSNSSSDKFKKPSPQCVTFQNHFPETTTPVVSSKSTCLNASSSARAPAILQRRLLRCPNFEYQQSESSSIEIPSEKQYIKSHFSRRHKVNNCKFSILPTKVPQGEDSEKASSRNKDTKVSSYSTNVQHINIDNVNTKSSCRLHSVPEKSSKSNKNFSSKTLPPCLSTTNVPHPGATGTVSDFQDHEETTQTRAKNKNIPDFASKNERSICTKLSTSRKSCPKNLANVRFQHENCVSVSDKEDRQSDCKESNTSGRDFVESPCLTACFTKSSLESSFDNSCFINKTSSSRLKNSLISSHLSPDCDSSRDQSNVDTSHLKSSVRNSRLKSSIGSSSSENVKTSVETPDSRGRSARRDVDSKDYWTRIRSLSRNSRQRDEQRREQLQKAEVEERRRRAKVLSDRRQQRQHITQKFLREPLHKYTKRRSSHSPQSSHSISGSPAPQSSQSVPNLAQAGVRGDCKQLAEEDISGYGWSASSEDLSARHQLLDIAVTKSRSSPILSSEATTNRDSRSFLKKLPQPKVAPPGRTPEGRIYRLCHKLKAEDNWSVRDVSSDSSSVIRENQKPYPTRSPEELQRLQQYYKKDRSKNLYLFQESPVKTGTTEALRRSFRVTDASVLRRGGRSKMEYLPVPDSRLLLMEKPKLNRRRSMPDLNEFKCVSSAVVYETIATLSNLADTNNLILVPTSLSFSSSDNVHSTNASCHENSIVEDKWSHQLSKVLQNDTENVFSTSPLLHKLGPSKFNSQNKPVSIERETYRKEWISKHTSIHSMKYEIIDRSVSVNASVQTDSQRWKPYQGNDCHEVKQFTDNESVYYDSLEEDEGVSRSCVSNQAFFVSVDNEKDYNETPKVQLPPRLSERLLYLQRQKEEKNKSNKGKYLRRSTTVTHENVSESFHEEVNKSEIWYENSSNPSELPPVVSGSSSSRSGSARSTASPSLFREASLPAIVGASPSRSGGSVKKFSDQSLTSVGEVSTLGLARSVSENDENESCSSKDAVVENATYSISSNTTPGNSLEFSSSLSTEDDAETRRQFTERSSALGSENFNMYGKCGNSFSDSEEEVLIVERHHKASPRIHVSSHVAPMNVDHHPSETGRSSDSNDIIDSLESQIIPNEIASESARKTWNESSEKFSGVKLLTDESKSMLDFGSPLRSTSSREDGYEIETDDGSICTESSGRITVIAAGRSSRSSRSLDMDSPVDPEEDGVAEDTAPSETDTNAYVTHEIDAHSDATTRGAFENLEETMSSKITHVALVEEEEEKELVSNSESSSLAADDVRSLNLNLIVPPLCVETGSGSHFRQDFKKVLCDDRNIDENNSTSFTVETNNDVDTSEKNEKHSSPDTSKKLNSDVDSVSCCNSPNEVGEDPDKCLYAYEVCNEIMDSEEEERRYQVHPLDLNDSGIKNMEEIVPAMLRMKLKLSSEDAAKQNKVQPLYSRFSCSENEKEQIETISASKNSEDTFNEHEPNRNEKKQQHQTSAVSLVPDNVSNEIFFNTDGSVTSTDESASSLLSTIEEEAEPNGSARSSNAQSEGSRTFENITMDSEDLCFFEDKLADPDGMIVEGSNAPTRVDKNCFIVVDNVGLHNRRVTANIGISRDGDDDNEDEYESPPNKISIIEIVSEQVCLENDELEVNNTSSFECVYKAEAEMSSKEATVEALEEINKKSNVQTEEEIDSHVEGGEAYVDSDVEAEVVDKEVIYGEIKVEHLNDEVETDQVNEAVEMEAAVKIRTGVELVEAAADAEVEAAADAEVEAPADAEVEAPADAEVEAPADAEVEAPADAEGEVDAAAVSEVDAAATTASCEAVNDVVLETDSSVDIRDPSKNDNCPTIESMIISDIVVFNTECECSDTDSFLVCENVNRDQRIVDDVKPEKMSLDLSFADGISDYSEEDEQEVSVIEVRAKRALSSDNKTDNEDENEETLSSTRPSIGPSEMILLDAGVANTSAADMEMVAFSSNVVSKENEEARRSTSESYEKNMNVSIRNTISPGGIEHEGYDGKSTFHTVSEEKVTTLEKRQKFIFGHNNDDDQRLICTLRGDLSNSSEMSKNAQSLNEVSDANFNNKEEENTKSWLYSDAFKATQFSVSTESSKSATESVLRKTLSSDNSNSVGDNFESEGIVCEDKKFDISQNDSISGNEHSSSFPHVEAISQGNNTICEVSPLTFQSRSESPTTAEPGLEVSSQESNSSAGSNGTRQVPTTSPSTDSGVVEMPVRTEAKHVQKTSTDDKSNDGATMSSASSRLFESVSSIKSRTTTPDTSKLHSRPQSAKPKKETLERIRSGHRSTYMWVQSTLQNDIMEASSDDDIKENVIYKNDQHREYQPPADDDDNLMRRLWEPCHPGLPDALESLPSPTESFLSLSSRNGMTKQGADDLDSPNSCGRDEDRDRSGGNRSLKDDHGRRKDDPSDISMKLIKAMEKRRIRRRRTRASSIDAPDRSYKPASLSSLDRLLASLPRYHGHENDGCPSDGSSIVNKPPASLSGAAEDGMDQVTVQVIAGRQQPDVRVTASRNLRLLVQVGGPEDPRPTLHRRAAQSSFVRETEKKKLISHEEQNEFETQHESVFNENRRTRPYAARPGLRSVSRGTLRRNNKEELDSSTAVAPTKWKNLSKSQEYKRQSSESINLSNVNFQPGQRSQKSKQKLRSYSVSRLMEKPLRKSKAVSEEPTDSHQPTRLFIKRENCILTDIRQGVTRDSDRNDPVNLHTKSSRRIDSESRLNNDDGNHSVSNGRRPNSNCSAINSSSGRMSKQNSGSKPSMVDGDSVHPEESPDRRKSVREMFMERAIGARSASDHTNSAHIQDRQSGSERAGSALSTNCGSSLGGYTNRDTSSRSCSSSSASCSDFIQQQPDTVSQSSPSQRRVQKMISDLRHYYDSKTSRRRNGAVRNTQEYHHHHHHHSEGDDVFVVKGSSVQKCFPSPSPQELKIRLKPKAKNSDHITSMDDSALQLREQERLQRNISAINDLLKSLN